MIATCIYSCTHGLFYRRHDDPVSDIIPVEVEKIHVEVTKMMAENCKLSADSGKLTREVFL